METEMTETEDLIHRTTYLDGKPIAYTNHTVFEVQSGRGKSAYRNRFAVEGDLRIAVIMYSSINIGRGYKKRLVMVGANKPVLARQFS
jgi:hypothetical protein